MSALLNDMLFAAIAGFGFAYACNPPLKTLIFSALLAAIAHGLRFALLNYFHFQTLAIATFMASFCIGCLGILCAKISKTPAEIITFPALIYDTRNLRLSSHFISFLFYKKRRFAS